MTMPRRIYRILALLLCGMSPLAIAPAVSTAQTPEVKAPTTEPQALQILKQMSDYLGKLPQFSVQAEISEDILLDSGQKIQYSRSVTAKVRRPNGLRVESVGDLGNQQLFYDGKTMTLMDVSQNRYATLEVPPEIDSALRHSIQTYNLRAPLSDFIYVNAYQYLTQAVTAGYYIGLSRVQGQECHHLAFRQADIDWQIWIENDSTPVPRKLVITDKAEAEKLQFAAVLSNWNSSPQLADSTFTAVLPSQAQRVTLPPIAAPVSPKSFK
ncbi:MAG: DUF2092 domain-containing protein [Chloroflexaceae bacterium]|nr:DUF2092 domain-containing protein [Chloroflexaceae bacterium]